MSFQEKVRQAHLKRDDYLDAQQAVNELAYELATTHFEIMTDCAETLEQLTMQSMVDGLPRVGEFYGQNEAIGTMLHYLALTVPSYENFTLGEIVQQLRDFMETAMAEKIREQFDVVVRHRSAILKDCRESLKAQLAAENAA